MQTRWLPALPFLLAAWSPILAAERDVPFCQILDRADQPAWEIQADYRNRASVEAPGGHSFSVLEIHGGGGLYFTEAPGGSVEVGGTYAGYLYEGDGGVELPNQALDLHLDAAYVWRHWDGRALLLRIQPGLYGEASALNVDAFHMPFEVTGVQALSPRLSGLLGVVIYPGFARPFDPRFGVRYALSDTWSVDLQYPESRVLWRSLAGAEAYALIRNDPINEFWLDEDDPRETYQFEETRAALGCVIPLGELLRLRLEAAYLFNRSVDFAREAPSRSVEEGVLLGVGLGGSL